MTTKDPELAEAQEELLLLLASEEARSFPRAPVPISRLAALFEPPGKECRGLLQALQGLGLVTIHDAPPFTIHHGPGDLTTSTASLTDRGTKLAHERALVDPKGPVAEFSAGLSPLQLKVLDTVAERETRAAGSSITRGQLRAAIRNVSEPTLSLERVDQAIGSLAGRFLEVGKEPGSSTGLTAAGLLASRWGINAVAIVDGLFLLLREALGKDAVMRQYGWRQARQGLGLPHKAHDLFYVTVTRCGLGRGIHYHSGDDWWTVPDDIDEILEETSAVGFLRKVALPAPMPIPDPGVAVSEKKGEIVMQEPQADPKKVFIIHGRNVAARNAVEQFVTSLGLEALDFDHVSADLGGSPFVGEVVRRGMDLAQGIIALFTPDEFSALRPNFHVGAEKAEEIQRWQSRPNVIFEAGMAYGMASKRTVLVTLGSEVSLFSDVAGIHLVRLDNHVESRKKLRQKLIGMKCSVNERADAWTDPARSGDFETCIKGLPEVSTRSPFSEPGTASSSPGSLATTLAVTPSAEAVTLNLFYRRLPNSSGDIHHYELAAVLRNGSKKRLDDWYIEVELPTPLEEPHTTVSTRVRSQAGITLFRTSDRLKPILAGEEFQYTIPYRMDDDVFDRFQGVLDQWTATGRAFVDGQQVAETTLREIQSF